MIINSLLMGVKKRYWIKTKNIKLGITNEDGVLDSLSKTLDPFRFPGFRQYSLLLEQYTIDNETIIPKYVIVKTVAISNCSFKLVLTKSSFFKMIITNITEHSVNIEIAITFFKFCLMFFGLLDLPNVFDIFV